MTTSLFALHSLAVALAGTDYMWNSPDAPSTLDSAHRRGLTRILAHRQGWVCAACGDDMRGERYDLCHIVASRRTERGVMPGNAYVGHTSCNSDDDKRYAVNGGVVPLASLVRSDVVQTVHPTRAECVRHDRKGSTVKRDRQARRDAALAG